MTEKRREVDVSDVDKYAGYMKQALEQAAIARQAGDHPYGSVLVGPAGVIAERNRVVSGSDPTAHSEVKGSASVPRRGVRTCRRPHW